MPERRVFPLPIIIRFNIGKDTGLSHAAGHVLLVVHEFDLQGMREALRHRIIIAGGLAPHATKDGTRQMGRSTEAALCFVDGRGRARAYQA